MATLTNAQIFALVDLRDYGKGHASALALGRQVVVFRNLCRLGLVECTGGSGQHAVWQITDAGRDRLRAIEEE